MKTYQDFIDRVSAECKSHPTNCDECIFLTTYKNGKMGCFFEIPACNWKDYYIPYLSEKS